MHGSPMSKYDNRNIWDHINYRDYDIIAEPYFDTDFSKVMYLTDTGRRWDGAKYAVRDKVQSDLTHNCSTTFDVINKLNNKEMPEVIMHNIHPQRWSDNPIEWTSELVLQNVKKRSKKNTLR